MNEIEKIVQEIEKFRTERDWHQFHNLKDMALSLVLESSEVLEHFQWKNGAEVRRYAEDSKDDIGEELADVLYWVLLMSHDLEIDILKALRSKIEKNAKKYPISKSKGKYDKYDKL